MDLNQLIKELEYGELSAHGMFATSPLSNENKDKLISAINIGLTELYTRFPLLTKELTIIQKSWLTEYKLDKKFAVSNEEDKGTKYILDTKRDPFLNDVIHINGVFDEVGSSLLHNSNSACKVYLTPAMDTIEIPNPTDTNALFIVYRANHPIVSEVTPTILLPINFKPALMAYVSHRIYSGGTAQEHAMLANSMLQKFELICMQQREYGMTNQDDGCANGQFCKGGWV